MTPAARVQSAIELLDSVIEAARAQGPPADRILAQWFKDHRFAGSKDRRAIRELVFSAIRVCGPVPDSGRAAMLRLAQTDPAIAPLFDGSHYGPEPMAEGETAAEGGIAPDWLAGMLAASGIEGAEAGALLDRAPLDIRVNSLKAERAGLDLPEQGEPLAAPHALRFPTGTRVEQWEAYREGRIEVQDHGSQLVCEVLAAQPGETIIDLCAGAGGKTLALGAAMDNRGTLLACDTDRRRLSQLSPRARRAGATNIQSLLLDPGKEMTALAEWEGRADAVLVDAPCSGTGTWRRNPESRWRLTPETLEKLTATQAHILDTACRLLKPGGRLVYAVCSLLDDEGAGQFDRFLSQHPRFTAHNPDLSLGRPRGKGIRLTPYHDGTDGFFIACAS